MGARVCFTLTRRSAGRSARRAIARIGAAVVVKARGGRALAERGGGWASRPAIAVVTVATGSSLRDGTNMSSFVRVGVKFTNLKFHYRSIEITKERVDES